MDVFVSQVAHCSVCGDLGWVRRFVGPEEWRTEVERCQCRATEDEARRSERALGVSDVSASLASCSFASYDGKHNARAAAVMRAWAEGTGPAWAFLYGGMGTGKTHLLGASLAVLRDRSVYPVYVVVPLLLDHIRDGYSAGDYGERFGAIMRCPALVLDDLGAELRTDWSDQALFLLLDYRYRHRLLTAVASNLVPGDLEPRIASRLQDGGLVAVVQMTGPDYRLAGARMRVKSRT